VTRSRLGVVALVAILISIAGALLLPALAGAASGSTARPAAAAASDAATSNSAFSEATSTENPLSIPKAALLGLVEGVTEYLPVSSTGHLLITERLLGLGEGADKAATDGYTVVIQIGAIIAVLGIYRKRFVSMGEGLLGRSEDGRRSLIAVVAAFIPAAIIGQILGDTIKEHLLAPWPVAGAWIVGGVVILVFSRFQGAITATMDSVSQLTARHALIIGLAQTLALWPGTSRSLVTIIAGVLLGLRLQAAVEFSFLLGFVTLSAATAYELLGSGGDILDTFGIVTPLIGIVVAGIAAFVSVRFMIEWLNRRGLAIFGWYRLAAGAAAIVLITTGTI